MLKSALKKIAPRQLQSVYHYAIALLGALIYRFPSKQLKVIGITGTKGKTSTAEILNSILIEAGHKTALVGTLRFKIDQLNTPNTKRMTMPGRFFLQKLMRKAIKVGCTHAIIEMTSEGVKQHRHRFINLDCLIYTNLAPEHIESHGSFENYRGAKRDIVNNLVRSSKKDKLLVLNRDDKEGVYLSSSLSSTPTLKIKSFSLKDAERVSQENTGRSFIWHGTNFATKLEGEFNLRNIISALNCARHIGISTEYMQKGLGSLDVIPGRMQDVNAGQKFRVIVDYAHTPDSLLALYSSFDHKRKICVLGATGGGRDTWKRKEMGKLSDQYCDIIILTNEDPYDEPPRKIVDMLRQGVTLHTPQIIMDRGEAIEKSIALASENDVVLITGKGTDPSICGPNGTQIPWSDTEVAREKISKVLATKNNV